MADWFDREAGAWPRSLYVHIPFCKSRCFYCDFNTYVAPERVMEDYVDGLAREWEMIAQEGVPPLRTVFFGGGTPTLLADPLLARMLQSLHAHFSLDEEAEVTFEANPDSITPEKLRVLREYGVNRISFGAQTFRDHLLMAIGRAHDSDAISAAVDAAFEAGFRHINIDLMFGLPEQTIEDVEDSLLRVLALPIDHVSAYWLKVEPGTPFAKWQELGQLPLPGEDEEADMYDLVRDTLTQNGFCHYEISNFAKPGAEARHNLVYWRNQPYLAAGAGAHGYVGGVRHENLRKIRDYLDAIALGRRPYAEETAISIAERMEDQVMLGLRLAEGVSAPRFQGRFGLSIEEAFGDVWRGLLAQGLVVEVEGGYRIPAGYWPVANAIFAKCIGAVTVD
ncbi:oxygen-independent coproporphyrinogen-III oxidase-like protein YqeR [Alicyclobacillus hesperidum subsp. aegles]|uniref:radical SAM family heme chaperone HemW n=1 Tax=Alicyclobacillus hesperidum TaxID=89784 RepID=UPI00071914F9|nr:radical SAM family heme chaperone HemW [Alicyclobacillus hesperidum]KRW91695.1 coproporphyrinogen III oxidase [Alicyclobacillus tengchongensis]GLG00315.1 oxygen-independent coproporphyrinogen-III oxidase-like protein YqeR [Alicyclobacillus hesperidum subsp. aegles]